MSTASGIPIASETEAASFESITSIDENVFRRRGAFEASAQILQLH